MFARQCSTSWGEKKLIHFPCVFVFAQVIHGVRVAQLEEAWTVNHAVGRSSPSWVKFKKSLQKAFNPKIAWCFGLRPKLWGPVYHNNTVGALKIHLYHLTIGQVLRLPGAVNPDVLRFASLQNTLTVPEVVDTENWVNSILPAAVSSRSGRYWELGHL